MRKVMFPLLLAAGILACEGPAGPLGPAGPQGETGETGEQGEQGAAGAAGAQGAQGAAGPQGEQGEQGEPGQVEEAVLISVPLTYDLYEFGEIVVEDERINSKTFRLVYLEADGQAIPMPYVLIYDTSLTLLFEDEVELTPLILITDGQLVVYDPNEILLEYYLDYQMVIVLQP